MVVRLPVLGTVSGGIFGRYFRVFRTSWEHVVRSWCRLLLIGRRVYAVGSGHYVKLYVVS